MKSPRFSSSSRWLIFPPVVLGIAAVVYAVNQRVTLESAEIEETSRTLRVITVPEWELTPRVLGYGTAQPVKVWEAVAEVQGDVIEVHPELRTGALIDAGTILLQIDRTEYELALESTSG